MRSAACWLSAASNGVANLTVRGAYRVLVEEGLVESVPKRGFFVRRPDQVTWTMTAAQRRRRREPLLLDGWAADVAAAGRSVGQRPPSEPFRRDREPLADLAGRADSGPGDPAGNGQPRPPAASRQGQQ
jgi:hypothetical protein